MSRITLRAKSDGTEISGELFYERPTFFEVQLAPKADSNAFNKTHWERVPVLPTEPGTIFEAVVKEMGKAQQLVALQSLGLVVYYVLSTSKYVEAKAIDTSTIRIGKVVFE